MKQRRISVQKIATANRVIPVVTQTIAKQKWKVLPVINMTVNVAAGCIVLKMTVPLVTPHAWTVQKVMTAMQTTNVIPDSVVKMFAQTEPKIRPATMTVIAPQATTVITLALMNVLTTNL
jgi:hypothetical protein